MIVFFGRLAQLARAPRLHRGCRGFESLIAHYLIWQRNALSGIFWQYRGFSVSFQGGLRASTALCVRLLRRILRCFFKVSIGNLPVMLLGYLYGVSQEGGISKVWHALFSPRMLEGS